MDISAQTVLVTGAGRGLGAGIARALAQAGARVVTGQNLVVDGGLVKD